ncbi:MAG: phosphoribosylanthranilate isomerase [Alphaproteobacteria bacterium GM202ARS2]|nr:phosphoribosylanthranilate isomerase [Alphaproteobacteria bacterium GM202ARS2]
MSVRVKICGVKESRHIPCLLQQPAAAYVGLVFYPRSPRFVSVSQASALIDAMPASLKKVGVVVDGDDHVLHHIISHVALDFLQCHGEESCARIATIKSTFAIKVIKAIKVRCADDIKKAGPFQSVADMLLFDAAAPHSLALPGGSGRAFEWTWLDNFRSACPWFLSGGLDADNLSVAVRTSGATHVDVSSGVERAPGEKDSSKIRSFLDNAALITQETQPC